MKDQNCGRFLSRCTRLFLTWQRPILHALCVADCVVVVVVVVLCVNVCVRVSSSVVVPFVWACRLASRARFPSILTPRPSDLLQCAFGLVPNTYHSRPATTLNGFVCRINEAQARFLREMPAPKYTVGRRRSPIKWRAKNRKNQIKISN